MLERERAIVCKPKRVRGKTEKSVAVRVWRECFTAQTHGEKERE